MVSWNGTSSRTSRCIMRDERKIGFGDGFEEPLFLEKFFVLRVAHERQVRVKNEREVTGRLHSEIVGRFCETPRLSDGV